MKLLKVDTIEQARGKIASYVKSWKLKTETLPLCETLQRILAEDIFNTCDIPSFRRSTVDGYAVIASDTSGAGESIPVFLKQVGAVLTGKPADFSLESGECAYVPTGGMLPGGADAVVMIEYSEQVNVSNEKKDTVIAIYEAVASGAGTVEAGEDFKSGELLLKKGTLMRPQEIGALSAAGIVNASVYAPLRIAIISTGDELTVPDKEPALGEIRDINTNSLKALSVRHGYKTVLTQVLGDDETQLENAVREAMFLSDIVIISGGSSQGEKDFTAMIIDRAAKPGVFTRGLAVKPGKPAILGWDDESQTLLAGLPGHPVSAIMIFELMFGASFKNELFKIVRPSFMISHSLKARISCNIPGSPGKTLCMPVALTFNDGVYTAQPVFGKAGMISVLTRADGYIVIDINKEGLNKDETVMVHLF